MDEKSTPDRQLPTRTEGEDETLDMPEGLGWFSQGQILGERYQILEMLGRGGMGEVWRAFDLKLRVDVALKALRPEFFKSERRLELLRQEVRAAREVVSPNVCRIFDLIEVEGRELVSMEYVGGATLLGVLQERGPLELKEAQDIASQFLAGLEAIHKVGLVHRDIKPENIMLTRAGRVVVMDFGLARQEAEGGGSVSGTPAYMSPEQAAGQTLDARADVYAAGVVLAEMVSPDGITSYESRQTLWEGVRSEPAKVPDTPWADVIKKAVAKDREQRYHTSQTLTRALEDVTLRVAGAEDLHPYPGLASFTEEDAEYFFGREAEVEQMWRRLEGPPRMLGLVGPSGAGKTSFLRAGLIPAARPNWGVIRCTPGTSPMSALREAMVAEVSGDSDAMKDLVRTADPSATVSVAARWRQRRDHALLIVDQFEELVTLNSEEDQLRFASVLHDLVVQADISVLLSMRDDYLVPCHRHEALRPVVADLTLLHPPTGGGLRRALIQPALQCGYRFEDDEMVDEMLAEVEGERGALPLLAFAAARLWEKRDRETGLLSRQACDDIDGVGGALARHAEATIDRIGHEHIGVVREIFRNLVTAEGTRAVREWDELLSVFDPGDVSKAGVKPAPTKNGAAVGASFIAAREAADEVLRELIDARLLTSYEVREEDNEPTRRVEIIHESLLANWPRLVRWQTQDADAAQLRDQLRQAARMWNEHDRTDELLWTGATYREFASWRERHTGGLSELEDNFARAMDGHARRRRRRRRMAVAAALLLGAASTVVFASLWRQAEQAALRAEAEKLTALGRARLEDYPTAAVAYATSSLGLVDTTGARRLAVEALWRGPPARILSTRPGLGESSYFVQHAISPDGRWLATASQGGSILLFPHDGGVPQLVKHPRVLVSAATVFSPDSSRVAVDVGDSVVVHDVLSGKLVQRFPLGPNEGILGRGGGILRIDFITRGERDEAVLRLQPFDGGEPRAIDVLDLDGVDDVTLDVDPQLQWLASVRDGAAFLRPVANPSAETRIGIPEYEALRVTFSDDGDQLIIELASGEVHVRPVLESEATAIVVPARPRYIVSVLEGGFWPGPYIGLRVDDSGTWFASASRADRAAYLRDLGGPPEFNDVILRRPDAEYTWDWRFDPGGRWLTVMNDTSISFWSLNFPYVRVLNRAFDAESGSLILSPDGRWLASVGLLGEVHLRPTGPLEGRGRQTGGFAVAFHPDGDAIATAFGGGRVELTGIKGGPPTVLIASAGGYWTKGLSFDRAGQQLAMGTSYARDPSDVRLRVADLETGRVRSFDQLKGFAIDLEDWDPTTRGIVQSEFAPDGTLYTAGYGGVRRWNLETADSEFLVEADKSHFDLSPDGRLLVAASGAFDNAGLTESDLTIFDLEKGTSQDVLTHGSTVNVVAFDPSGEILATGDGEGIVRVGPLSGEEPHLLLGHEGRVTGLVISPDGRWIYSAGGTEIRRWSMPNVKTQPLHTLPRRDLVAKLETLTNLQAVRDEGFSTGWKLEVGPFPGWAEVPEW